MVSNTIAAAAARAAVRRNAGTRRIARAWKYGAPFVLFTVGGLFALSSVVDLKFEKQDTQVKKQSERQFELEEEHEVQTQFLRTAVALSLEQH
jgi:hypothetical protein